MKIKLTFVLMAAMILVCILACQQGPECPPLSEAEMDQMIKTVKSMPLEPVGKDEVAVLETSMGEMVIDFYEQKAPQHSAAFKRLVRAGYYDCTAFHRVVKGFMIQGGDLATRDTDPSNDGRGAGPGYTLQAEFNDLPHDKGVVSMARKGGDPNSAGSQFFICLSREKTRHLDGQYTVFGHLVEGMDVLERIGNVETVPSPVYGAPVLPAESVIIEAARMETRE
jgi:cyclophilin family peptidyl-prolyl cis-trans isomerase